MDGAAPQHRCDEVRRHRKIRQPMRYSGNYIDEAFDWNDELRTRFRSAANRRRLVAARLRRRTAGR